MNQKKLAWAVLPLLCFCVVGSEAAAAGWGIKVTRITGFYTWNNGNAHLQVADMENPDGCANPRYLTVDGTSAHFKELYATIMAAYTSGSTVQLSYSGCTAGGYPLINAIAVPQVW